MAMKAWVPIAGLLGIVALYAMRGARAARTPRGTVALGPIRVIRTPKAGAGAGPDPVVPSPPPRGAGSGARAPVPVRVSFFVKVGGFEKLGVSASDVKGAVLDNYRAVPVVQGRPRVSASSVSGGYNVTAVFPDSAGTLTTTVARRAIESVDSRLQGRVSKVTVRHA